MADFKDRAHFKDRVLALRKQARLSQKDLAAKLGASRATVSLWEIGARVPEVGHLEGLARTFEVSTDYLLGRVDEPSGHLVRVDEYGTDSPMDDLITFLRGHQLTEDDVEAVKDLLEARKLRRQREEREQCQP